MLPCLWWNKDYHIVSLILYRTRKIHLDTSPTRIFYRGGGQKVQNLASNFDPPVVTKVLWLHDGTTYRKYETCVYGERTKSKISPILLLISTAKKCKMWRGLVLKGSSVSEIQYKITTTAFDGCMFSPNMVQFGASLTLLLPEKWVGKICSATYCRILMKFDVRKQY